MVCGCVVGVREHARPAHGRKQIPDVTPSRATHVTPRSRSNTGGGGTHIERFRRTYHRASTMDTTPVGNLPSSDYTQYER
eukprot:gene10851-biopygen4683